MHPGLFRNWCHTGHLWSSVTRAFFCGVFLSIAVFTSVPSGVVWQVLQPSWCRCHVYWLVVPWHTSKLLNNWSCIGHLSFWRTCVVWGGEIRTVAAVPAASSLVSLNAVQCCLGAVASVCLPHTRTLRVLFTGTSLCVGSHGMLPAKRGSSLGTHPPFLQNIHLFFACKKTSATTARVVIINVHASALLWLLSTFAF